MGARQFVTSGAEYTGPSKAEIHAANLRGAETMQGPRAISAAYDKDRNSLCITLTTGTYIGFPVAQLEGLSDADPLKVANVIVEPPGLGLHWPELDVDLYVPALLEGVFGSRKWMASQLGAAGGGSTSEAKAASARLNGKKGGRPRKNAVA